MRIYRPVLAVIHCPRFWRRRVQPRGVVPMLLLLLLGVMVARYCCAGVATLPTLFGLVACLRYRDGGTGMYMPAVSEILIEDTTMICEAACYWLMLQQMLKPLIEIALQIAQLHELTGRKEPDVIT